MRPEPFYTLARELYPGNESRKIPNSLIVEAHGSFATAHCIGGRLPLVEDFEGDETTYASSCGKEYSQEWVKTKILAGEIPTCSKCNGLVKPDVQPFASLLSRVSPKTPRLFINRNLLGGCIFPGDCDDGCQKLAELLGFGDELEKLLIYEHGRILVESERTSMPPMQSPTQPEITQTSSQKIGGTEHMKVYGIQHMLLDYGF
ncbi:hypothetical protein BC829DRAFT_386283 [Chytridium lagenaria]|nr:hypothetical protein BC829DRAFT_386283 [Chytridium lagenaria]